MKRENEKFEGILTDKELGIIEDALNCLEKTGGIKQEEAKKLVQKLYDFWEVK